MMALHWTCEGSGYWCSRCALGQHGIAQLVVERLDRVGWGWQVWDAAGRALPCCGSADSLDQAKERAWRAVADLARELEPEAEAADLAG